MAAPEPNFKDTLNKMANLEELSKFVVAQNAALEAKRGMIIKTLSGMQNQVSKIRDQIDNIRSQGTTAKTEIKQLISDADGKQKQSLQNVKNSITAMLNTDKLVTSVKNLEGDIDSLASVSGSGTNPGAPEFKPSAGPGPAPAPGPGPAPSPAPAAKPTPTPAPAAKPATYAAAAAKGANMKGGYTYGKSRRSGKHHKKRRTRKARRKAGRR